jgi:hypothetical protein
MKTKQFLVLCLLIFGFTSVFGQHGSFPVYPIPSTNVVVDGYADFANPTSPAPLIILEKRQVHIHVLTVSLNQPDCQATVWVYSLDGTTVLGPFTVLCGQTIDVDIDNRDWGVLVDSEAKIEVDVWFTGS